MKNKKGFTLIELLAVIVILAIIALIAVPIVLNMIEKSRKQAAVDSAYGYIEAIESNNGLADIEISEEKEENQRKYTLLADGEYGDGKTNALPTIKMKGKRPTSGTLTISKGKVTSATDLCFNGYKVSYNGKEATAGSKCGTVDPETIAANNVGFTPTNSDWKVNGSTVNNISDALDSLYDLYD